jgi:hypothetical protein
MRGNLIIYRELFLQIYSRHHLGVDNVYEPN